MTTTRPSAPRPASPLPGLAFAALALAFGAVPALAAWPAGGVKLCGRLTLELSPAIAGTPDGGAIVAWVDTRARTEYDIYAQRVTAAGAIQWGSNGAPVCLGLGDQDAPQVASDDAGGAFIVWQDHRYPNAPTGLFVQRLMADGTIAPGWPAGGRAICDSSLNSLTPYRVAKDGQGGLFVAWSDSGAASLPGVNVKVQRIGPGGLPAPGWPAGGVNAGPAATEQSEPVIVADGAGGAFVAWTDATADLLQSDILAQHLDAGGARAAGWPAGGLPVVNAANRQFGPDIAPDGNGGFVAAWVDRRSGDGDVLYAQRMSAGGAAVWTFNGLAISASAQTMIPGKGRAARALAGVNGMGAPFVDADGAGGVVIGWTAPVLIGEDEYRYDVMAQRVDAGGGAHAGWPAGGFAVCTGLEGSRFVTGLVVDPQQAGSAIVGWYDGRPSAFGAYRAVLAPGGGLAAGEPANGRPLIGTSAPQTSPVAAASAAGGAIMVLLKMIPNSSFYADPYGQRVFADGLVGVDGSAPERDALAIASIRPNPSRGVMRVRMRLSVGTPVTVTLLDLAGRVRARQELDAGLAGEREALLEPSRPLEPGVYLVRVAQDGISVARRVAVVR